MRVGTHNECDYDISDVWCVSDGVGDAVGGVNDDIVTLNYRCNENIYIYRILFKFLLRLQLINN